MMAGDLTKEQAIREKNEEINSREIYWREVTDNLKAENRALYQLRSGEVWYWQGDGADHIESLTCPVLIEAQALRDLLGQLSREL